MIKARLLGFERETVKDDLMLPKPEFSLKLPIFKRMRWCTYEGCCPPPESIDIDYAEYELERVLSIDDGGPLAIYGRVR